MPFKDILVLCDAGEDNDSRMVTAFSLAKNFGAQVTGVHLTPFPSQGSLYPPYVANSAAALIDITSKHTNNLKETLEKITSNTNNLKASFEMMASKMNISCDWKDMGNSNIHYIIDIARSTDLVIVPQSYSQYGEYEPKRFNDYFTTHLGRPLLVVPDLKKVFNSFKKVIIAWNESKEATRAVHDALPFLEFSENIEVISIAKNEKEEKKSMIRCNDLRTHLSHHGLDVEVLLLARSSKGVGHTLIQHALEYDADLIVMGAYGHSRIKEVILGGTTKYLLDQTKIPLFLSS
jgi:nucleotide-binding universal stress UspA family protein